MLVVVLAFVSALIVFQSDVAVLARQDLAASDTPTATPPGSDVPAPAEPEPEAAAPFVTVAAPPEPTEPAEQSAPAVEADSSAALGLTDETIAPTATPASAALALPVDESTEPTPTPGRVATLSYEPAAEPTCRPAGEGQEAVPSGGSLTYDCTYDVAITGEHVVLSAVVLAWTVQTAVAGGWAVQLLPPGPDATWSDAADVADFAYSVPLAAGPADDAPVTVATTETLAFGLRVHRPACDPVAQPVGLAVTVTASLPEDSMASVLQIGSQPLGYTLTPTLASVPEPVLAFDGPLNFGTVPVTAAGPAVDAVAGTLSLTVSDLDRACGDWQVWLRADELDGTGGSALPAARLRLVSVDGWALPDGGCDLAVGCPAGLVQAGPGAAPTVTYSLEIILTLPEEPHLGPFDWTLRASLAPA